MNDRLAPVSYEVSRWRIAAFAAAASVMAACGVEANGAEPVDSTFQAPTEQTTSPSTLSPTSSSLETSTTSTITLATAETTPSTMVLLEQEALLDGVIATMQIPRMCDINIQVIALGQDEIDNDVVGRGPDYENGGSHIDPIFPAANSQPDCPEATLHAKQERRDNPKHASRGERTNTNYPDYIDANDNGREDSGEDGDVNANDFVPLAGYWPGTAELGTPGNTVIFGHRTTQSAPFSEIEMLEVDDVITVATSGPNPRVLTYRVTEEFVVDETEVDRVLSQDTAGESWLTLFACTPQRDAAQRIIMRAILI